MGEEDEENESDMGEGDKEFEDVFDDIGDSPEYPKKKKKAIHKPNKQHKSKAKPDLKRQSYKNKKK